MSIGNSAVSKSILVSKSIHKQDQTILVILKAYWVKKALKVSKVSQICQNICKIVPITAQFEL